MSKQALRGLAVATALTVGAGALVAQASADAAAVDATEPAATSATDAAAPASTGLVAAPLTAPTSTTSALTAPSSTTATVTTATLTAAVTTGSTAGAAVVPQAVFTTKTSKSALRTVRSLAPARFGTATYNRWYARQYMGRKYRWDGAQYAALVAMWQRESSWRHKARNPSGKYLGIPQTSAAVVRGNGYTVAQYMASPEIQVEVGLRYIRARYGTPAKAWSFWRSHHWY